MKFKQMFPTACALFLASFFFFVAVRSNDYTAVDGPVRCLEVFHRNTLFFHTNNHLLYPAWILAWSKMAHFLGADITDPFKFMRLSQAMNAFGAALSLAALYVVLQEVTKSRFLPLLGTMILAFSRGFMLHATNAAEVVPGFAWCLVAIAGTILALKSGKPIYLPICGFMLVLALASYEAMGLSVFLAGFLCVVWPATDASQATSKAVLLRLTLFGLGCLTGVFAVYGFAYSSEGFTISQMPGQFFALGGGPEVYGGFTISKILNVPFGFLLNVIGGLPSNYGGIHSLFRPSPKWIWIGLVAAQFALCFLTMLLCCRALVAGRSVWMGTRWALLAGGFALCAAPIFFPLVYWGSLYDKLWLLPLALLIVIAVAAIEASRANGRLPQALRILLIMLAACEMAINVPPTIQASRTPTPYLDRAREVASLLRPGDAVVGGFDPVSILYISFFGNNQNWLVLPASNASTAEAWLRASREGSRRDGKKLYFLGVLDAPRAEWDLFLGSHLRIPYDTLELYRQNSQVVRTFECAGYKVTLRKFSQD